MKKFSRKVVPLIFILILVLIGLRTYFSINRMMSSMASNMEKTAEKFTIVQNFSSTNNEAVIKYGYGKKYFVVNENGKLYEFEIEENIGEEDFFVRGKYLIVSDRSTLDSKYWTVNYIKDLETKSIIAQGNEDKYYRDITEDGYLLYYEKTKSLSGAITTINVAKLTGEKILSLEPKGHGIFDVAYDNYIVYDQENRKRTFFDVTTRKDAECYYFSKIKDYSLKDNKMIITYSENEYTTIDLDTFESTQKPLSSVKAVNNKYICGESALGEGLYAFDGELVKKLDGGVKDIFYKDNKYYVYSDTGFYYSLDENLNYLMEPVELKKDYTMQFVEGGAIFTNDTEHKIYIEKYADFDNNKDFKEAGKVLDGSLKTISGKIEGKKAVFFEKKEDPLSMVIGYDEILNLETFEFAKMK